MENGEAAWYGGKQLDRLDAVFFEIKQAYDGAARGRYPRKSR